MDQIKKQAKKPEKTILNKLNTTISNLVGVKLNIAPGVITNINLKDKPNKNRINTTTIISTSRPKIGRLNTTRKLHSNGRLASSVGSRTSFAALMEHRAKSTSNYFDNHTRDFVNSKNDKSAKKINLMEEIRTEISHYTGTVIDTDSNIAKSIIEEDDGTRIEVDFEISKLSRIGIKNGDKFTYTIYDTGRGTQSVFSPLEPIIRQPEELQKRAYLAEQIAVSFPDPEQYETSQ